MDQPAPSASVASIRAAAVATDALSVQIHEQAACALRLAAVRNRYATPDEVPQLAALHADACGLARRWPDRRHFTFIHEGRRYRATVGRRGRVVVRTWTGLPLTVGLQLHS